jgi:hypothetical protein
MNDNFVTEYFGIGIQNGKTTENLGVLWHTTKTWCYIFITEIDTNKLAIRIML